MRALVGAFSVITNLRMELFEALVAAHLVLAARAEHGVGGAVPGVALQHLGADLLVQHLQHHS